MSRCLRGVIGWRGVLPALLAAGLCSPAGAGAKAKPPPIPTIRDGRGTPTEQARLRAELKTLGHRIVYESFRGRDWELFAMRADGSEPANLTRSPATQDLYPHASPDGSRICFVADAGDGKDKVRSVYCIGADGNGRSLVARGARQPCWSPDGRRIAYLKAEFERFTYKDYATKGVWIYDLASRLSARHPNASLHHLYNLCWSPCGRWFTATVHGGMGHKHANLAFPADDAKRVFKLPHVGGCRPDIRPDGKAVCWNASDQLIAVADIDLTASPPKVANVRKAVTCDKQHEVYHSDFSPDGKYIAFAYGPKAGELVGTMARDWHICVADAARRDVWVVLTKDGVSNKEPDWLPAAGKR